MVLYYRNPRINTFKNLRRAETRAPDKAMDKDKSMERKENKTRNKVMKKKRQNVCYEYVGHGMIKV